MALPHDFGLPEALGILGSVDIKFVDRKNALGGWNLDDETAPQDKKMAQMHSILGRMDRFGAEPALTGVLMLEHSESL